MTVIKLCVRSVMESPLSCRGGFLNEEEGPWTAATILHLFPTCPGIPAASHFTWLLSICLSSVYPICRRITKAVSSKSVFIHHVVMEKKGSALHATAKWTSSASGPPLFRASLTLWSGTSFMSDVRWALYQLLGQLLNCINQHRAFEFHTACKFTSSWGALPWAIIKYVLLKSLAWK